MAHEQKRFFRIQVTRPNGTTYEKLIYAETKYAAVEKCLEQNRGIQADRSKYKNIKL